MGNDDRGRIVNRAPPADRPMPPRARNSLIIVGRVIRDAAENGEKFLPVLCDDRTDEFSATGLSKTIKKKRASLGQMRTRA
jgi:hypothetical protein